jgi:hypothetical protein
MYTNMYFFILILCVNTRTSRINTNVLFDLIDFSGTTCPGCHPGEFLDQDGVRCLTCALGFFTEGRGSLFFMFNMFDVYYCDHFRMT